MRKIALALIPVLILSACGRQNPPKPIIPLVQEIMANEGNPYNKMLNEARPSKDGEICIIGSEEAVLRIADIFAQADERDNVNGSSIPDGLPDFAGETISCIIDTLNYPYEQYLESNNQELLKRITVQHVLTAIDTAYNISPFDEVGLGSKGRAKLIVLADPYLAQYGGFDADTLLRTFGCDVPIIAPLDIILSERIAQTKGTPTGILCNPRFTATGIYSVRFRDIASRNGVTKADCVVFPTPTDSTDIMKSFLDRYIAAGFTKPLNSLLIDDFNANPEEVKTSLANLISLMNEESVTYRKYIAEDFRVYESGAALKEECFSFLRNTNRFTHKISKPVISVYYSHSGHGEKEGSSVLIPDSYVQN